MTRHLDYAPHPNEYSIPATPGPQVKGTQRDQEIRSRLAYDAALDGGMGHEEAQEHADRYRRH